MGKQKKQPGARPGTTRVSVLIDNGGLNQVRVTSESTSLASAILNALDRAMASYRDDIEAETQTWVTKWSELTNVFKNALGLLPVGKGMMDRAEKQRQQTERETALQLQEESLARREQDHTVRETMLREERTAFDALKAAGDAITGESVVVPLSGPVTVRVNVNGKVHTYTETDVSRELVDPNNVKAVLTFHASAWNWDTATDLPDWQVAERILEHIGNLTAMNAEIKGAGNVLTKDPELEEHADDSDGPTDDAEATVGTGPVTTVHITPLDETGAPVGPTQTKKATAVELIRGRDRNLT